MSRKYPKLRGLMREKGITQETLGRLINKCDHTISVKLNGKGFFTVQEIDDICRVLDISNGDIGLYFFTD